MMQRRDIARPGPRWALAAASAALLLAGLMAFARPPQARAADAKKAGKETCATCHSEVAEKFAKTFHGRKSLSSAKLTESCESCHGPGAAHAESGDASLIVNPKKLGAAKVADLCLNCHKDKALTMWKTGAHAANEVSCIQCHSVHQGQGRKSVKAGTVFDEKAQTETCLKCHTKQRADMRLASHHPLPEGKMSCVSCHNPHGGIEGNLKADSAHELCATCHSEKVGPFANEHPPVADNCMNCHKPHGSANERLLKQPAPMLCMGCHRRAHGSAGSTTTQATALKRDRCVDCHHDIHGSNQQLEFAQ